MTPPPLGKGGGSLEGEDAEGSVGLVARVVRHLFAPEVVTEDAAQAGARTDVRVVDDGPHVVVDQLPVQRVAVAQRARGDQRGVARAGSEGGRTLATCLFPPRRSHLKAGSQRSAAGLTVEEAGILQDKRPRRDLEREHTGSE